MTPTLSLVIVLKNLQECFCFGMCHGVIDDVYQESFSTQFFLDRQRTLPGNINQAQSTAVPNALEQFKPAINHRLSIARLPLNAAQALNREEVARRKYPLDHVSVEPRVYLAANDNWIELALRYTVDAKLRRAVYDEPFMYILDAIAESEGRVQLASATFELVAMPALNVQFTKAHETILRDDN